MEKLRCCGSTLYVDSQSLLEQTAAHVAAWGYLIWVPIRCYTTMRRHVAGDAGRSPAT